MIVLGVNGWTDRTHDPAAALVVDGETVAFAEEERFTRSKHGVGQLPHAAVSSLFTSTGIHPSAVEAVACGWHRLSFDTLRGRTSDITDAVATITGVPSLSRLPMHWVRHHDAHAASTFYGSGLSEATVVVADAEGEDESISIYRADTDGIHELRRFGRGLSLGLMYRAVSEYCGFGQFGAGQTMGLASYGPENIDPLPVTWRDGDLSSPFHPNAWEDEVIAGWQDHLEQRFGSPGVRAPRHGASFPALSAHRPAAAAAAQMTVNSVMRSIVLEATRLTGLPDVCLAGGVALNCVSNGLLLDEVRTLHVPPYPHDAGVALGAAQWVANQNGCIWRAEAQADLGPTEEFLFASPGRKLPFRRVDPASAAAELVAQGAIVGWVQGRMEVGPRALGHRSILASPTSQEVRDRVNRLKGREPWRPVAPSLRFEDTVGLFGRPTYSPFMLMSMPLSEAGRERMPGASHIDGTARLQTVGAGSSPFRRLLDELHRTTGLGAVLNTSFNTRGEPIVRSEAEALASASAMGLDAVVVGDRLFDLRRV